MKNEEIAGVFSTIADLLELKGENVFKVRAYQRAARVLERHPVSLEQLVKEGREEELRAVPGVGEAIAKKIVDLVTTGRLELYEKLRGEFPDGLLRLMDVPGIGPRRALKITTELGVSTMEGLEKAILDGRLEAVPGLGPKVAENILKAVRQVRTKDQRIPLGNALETVEELTAELRKRVRVGDLTAAGSVRRRRETVGDIDLISVSDEPEGAIEAFVTLPQVGEVLVRGPKKASVRLRDGLQVDLRIVEREQLGSMLQYFTGSKQHNVLLRERARKVGLSLNEYGITHLDSGRLETFAREEDFYARLGLPWIPPELREGTAEIEAAEKGHLPRLVEEKDIRGDLHDHTDWSDGRDTLEAMVQAAVTQGYEYLAITDHSAGRGIANGLTEDRLREQIALVREAGKRYPGIRLLCGTECDIRSDGTLDYPEDLLAELDIVVASVHSAMGQDAEKMTARIIKAMRHPHVHVIGHPSCRLIGEREPVEADWEAIFRAAAETRTALEINANPLRLDLKDVHAARARELGVALIVSSDSHATGHLAFVRFGVDVARRAWCEPQHILNTRPVDEVLARLHRKPARARA